MAKAALTRSPEQPKLVEVLSAVTLHSASAVLGCMLWISCRQQLTRWCGCAVQNMLQAGLIIAGWDKQNGGSVHTVPLGGTLLQVPYSIGETILSTCPCLYSYLFRR